MTTTHADHHYSVTCHTDRLPVVFCLRALSQWAQRTGNARIPWGGTKQEDWRGSSNKVTFFFSDPDYRDAFKREAQRLLAAGSFTVVGERDDNPAKRVT